MLLDALSSFTGSPANSFAPQALTTGTIVSTYAYDLLAGGQVATSPGTYGTPNSIIGNASVFGVDFGIGNTAGYPRCVGEAIAAFVGGTSVTVQFVGQKDPGTGTLSTWTVFGQTAALATTLLTANTRIFSFDWPQRESLILGNAAAALPRFVALQFVISGTYTAGTVQADNAVGGSDDALNTLQQFPANFVVAA